MIYVNQKQLDQVEYLIEQSTRGHHILFDTDSIRRAFRAALQEEIKPRKTNLRPLAKTTGEETPEKHIENLILQPTLISKRAYLESLSNETYVRVVRTYFSIVENNIFEGMKYCQ